MKASVPVIAPLLRSDVQGSLLAELMIVPPRERTLTELTESIGASMPTVHREVNRLVESGFLLERRVGRNRYLSANVDHPLYGPVRQIVEHAYGPRAVLQRLLSSVQGVEEAYIYGSWAARMSGEEGPDPADIDVLILGRPDRAALYDLAATARSALGREVNIQTVSRRRWDAAQDPFLQTVRARPLMALSLQETGGAL